MFRTLKLAGLLVVACGSPEVGDAGRDSSVDTLDGEQSLEIGRCERPDGTECRGVENEVGRFVAVEEGSAFGIVRGHQGAEMIVVAARTATGIHPGNPDEPFLAENPIVEIDVMLEDGTRVATQRGLAAFSPDGMMLTTTGLFVVIDETQAHRIEGERLYASGTLTDRDGVERSGELALRVVR